MEDKGRQDPREGGHTIQNQGGHLKKAFRTPNNALFGEKAQFSVRVCVCVCVCGSLIFFCHYYVSYYSIWLYDYMCIYVTMCDYMFMMFAVRYISDFIEGF